MTYYDGNKPGNTPGILPSGEYYWPESGEMWNILIAYWRDTGDSSYNDITAQGLLWQAGPDNNFLTANQTQLLTNDDQGMWGMAAMTAAEVNFTNPSDKPETQWFVMAKNVFDDLAGRWPQNGSDSCGGGLNEAVSTFTLGYDFKNSISTGMLFNLASRLAQLTGNTTYADWADKAWTWTEDIGFMDNGTIYAGAGVEQNCTQVDRGQFSYTLGVFIEGAVHMYNSTAGSKVWEKRLSTLVGGVSAFTTDNCVPVETCERDVTDSHSACSTNMLYYKSIFLQGLAASVQFAPYTAANLTCVFNASASAVAATCDDVTLMGTHNGTQCGFAWGTGKDDQSYGAGQQMNALAALSIEYQLLAGPAGVANNGTTSSGGGSGSATQTGAASTTTGNSGAAVTAGRAGAGLLVACALLAAAFTLLLA